VRARIVIPVAVVVAIAGLLVGGALLYAKSRNNTIAKGVTVGGVDLGGLNKAAAEAKLNRRLLSRLQRKIVVNHGSHHYTLTIAKADVAVNVGASVQGAIDRSQTGSPFSRAFRDITGGSVKANITPQVTYSHRAVDRLIRRIRRGVNRDARNAKVSISGAGLFQVKARTGLKLKTHEVHQEIIAALTQPGADTSISAVTVRREPKVKTAAAEKQYSTALIVNRNKFTLTLYKKFKVVKTYRIAVGMQGLETPAGLYHIQNKAVNPGWQVPNSPWAGSLAGTFVPPGPQDPIKARWLGIIDGAGIHGIDPSEYGSIGTAGSHGCVRMTIPDVIDLYPRVPVGSPIYIA
jgi:lipoprotein-anchoring transpeptidase ErfK/SrfK